MQGFGGGGGGGSGFHGLEFSVMLVMLGSHSVL